MGKITRLGPNHDWTRGHLPKTFGFSQHERGSKTPAMPAAKAGPATPMAGDGKHGGGFPMGGTGQRAMPSQPIQHFAKGGAVKPAPKAESADAKEDKALVKKGVGQHEDQLHGGKRATLHLAKGGHVGKKHAAPKARDPVNRPPANPVERATPPNAMPGGALAYGVQPGTEADPAGGNQGIPQLKGGGKVRRK